MFADDRIIGMFWQLRDLHGDLLDGRLDRIERKRLGGQLSPIGPGLIVTLAVQTSRQPDLFPDTPASSEALLAEQRVASAWLLLRNRLNDMAQLASDAHLTAQARVNSKALPFVRKALAEQPPLAVKRSDAPARNLALFPAFLCLVSYYRSQEKTRARNQAAAAKAASPDAAAASPDARSRKLTPSPPPKHPEKLRAEADLGTHDRQEILHGFHDYLTSRYRTSPMQDLYAREDPAHIAQDDFW